MASSWPSSSASFIISGLPRGCEDRHELVDGGAADLEELRGEHPQQGNLCELLVAHMLDHLAGLRLLPAHELHRAGPRDRKDQGLDPVGVVEGDLGDGPAHGGAEDHGFVDLEVVEEPDGVVGHLVHGGGRGPAGASRAPVVEGDEAVPLGHGGDLARPVALVQAEAHDAQYRGTLAKRSIVELDIS